jgi:hypothetical protein
MTTVPVRVEQQNGTFTASVLGAETLAATAETKDLAVSTLVADLTARQSRGELVMVTLPQPFAPAVRERTPEERDALDEMLAEIYRARDEEKRREFPE